AAAQLHLLFIHPFDTDDKRNGLAIARQHDPFALRFIDTRNQIGTVYVDLHHSISYSEARRTAKSSATPSAYSIVYDGMPCDGPNRESRHSLDYAPNFRKATYTEISIGRSIAAAIASPRFTSAATPSPEDPAVPRWRLRSPARSRARP